MLGKKERIVLDTLLPARAHPNLQVGLFDTGFDKFYAGFERDAPNSFRLSFRVAIWAAIWISPLLIRRQPPLQRLDRSARECALTAMAVSRVYTLRQLYLALKTVAAFCYGADGQVRAAIGYPGSQPERRSCQS